MAHYIPQMQVGFFILRLKPQVQITHATQEHIPKSQQGVRKLLLAAWKAILAYVPAQRQQGFIHGGRRIGCLHRRRNWACAFCKTLVAQNLHGLCRTTAQYQVADGGVD